MTDVLIKRELLEDLRDAANDCLNHEIMRGNDRNVPAYTELVDQADAALSAPRQPEGEGLEVVESLHVWRATNRFGDTCHFGDAGCARIWAGNGGKVDRIELKPVPELYDVNHSDAAEVSVTEIKVVAWAHCADATRLLCDLGKQRSVPGHYADEFTIPLCRLSDHQRAIAELREECERLRMQLAACGVVALANTPESASEARQMHQDYMSASCSDVAGAVDREMTLRQQLAERDATIERLESGIPRIQEQSHQMRQQRDKLAGLLRRVLATHDYHTDDGEQAADEAHAALAEVNK